LNSKLRGEKSGRNITKKKNRGVPFSTEKAPLPQKKAAVKEKDTVGREYAFALLDSSKPVFPHYAVVKISPFLKRLSKSEKTA